MRRSTASPQGEQVVASVYPRQSLRGVHYLDRPNPRAPPLSVPPVVPSLSAASHRRAQNMKIAEEAHRYALALCPACTVHGGRMDGYRLSAGGRAIHKRDGPGFPAQTQAVSDAGVARPGPPGRTGPRASVSIHVSMNCSYALERDIQFSPNLPPRVTWRSTQPCTCFARAHRSV